MRVSRVVPLALVIAVGVFALTAALCRPAQAQGHDQYFIEFRARPSILGHTYIVYGHVDGAGQPLETFYAGNQPKDRTFGAYFGAILPVDGMIRSVPEDFQDRPTAVYRRRLTVAEYDHVKITVAHAKASERYWHLLFYNCNEFAIEVAHSIGMVSPAFPWMPPDTMVNTLRMLNGP